jgi:hypothetical protein
MDWFERLTGFVETGYDATKARLRIKDGRLHSLKNDKSYAIGTLELASLESLRRRSRAGHGRLMLSVIKDNARDLHRRSENAGALIQVASQFNLLEMMGPSVTPEHGVTIYSRDQTQGPVCAIAAGAATIYRNYFAPVGDQAGQTEGRQLDGLADLGSALSELTNLPVSRLWRMQNGYAQATGDGLRAIGVALRRLPPAEIDYLRGLLRVGFHANVEVTDDPETAGQTVSQVFSSALPIGYDSVPAAQWEPFARLVLEASYEATLHCAAINAAETGSRRAYLTLVGGGVFKNPREWIIDAIKRALDQFRETDLEVFIVSYNTPPADLLRLVAEFEAGL